MDVLGSFSFQMLGGYTWYVFPIDPISKGMRPGVTIGGTPRLMMQFPVPGDTASVVITDQPHKPELPDGWNCIPYNVPDGLTIERDGYKLRHVHTLHERPDEVYALFAGLVLPPKI